MAPTRRDTTEPVTDVYETTREGQDGLVVETDDGYFEYWFPYTPTPNYATTDGDFVLDLGKVRIRENPENPTTYAGSDPVNIPEHVIERAEQRSGHPRLE